MQLTLSTTEDLTGSLALEKGALAGQKFRLTAQVCQNPTCQCESITLDVQPDADGSPSPATGVRFEMDLRELEVSNLERLKSDRTTFGLARAIAAEIGAAEWNQLRVLYLTTKRRATENADPDHFEAVFPPELLLGEDATLVGYYEILPYATPTEFQLAGDRWLLDDQYCVRTDCDCRELMLSFFRLPSDGRPQDYPLEPVLTFRYNYQTSIIEAHEPAEDGGPTAQSLLAALQTVQPDLGAFIAGRHELLRRLYRRAAAKKAKVRLTGAEEADPFAPQSDFDLPALSRAAAAQPKVGRNEPCPCGSGKKYKKCCGA